LALANLESPLAAEVPTTPSEYNLCAKQDNAQFLSDAGLDLLSLANNHTRDCSPDGAGQTRSILELVGLEAIGPGLEPVYREVDGIILAFIALDDIDAPLDLVAARNAISHAGEQAAVVIVSIHWGIEYQAAPSHRQQSTALALADAGADLVWGHHPHVLQPIVWIDTDRARTLVLYSLGNALFDLYGLENTRQSALVSVELTSHGVSTYSITPFVLDAVRNTVIQPDPEDQAEIADQLQSGP
jgi:poly-gamma-glutamate synthesis protein (capsule biosynthesis protein)